MQLYPSSLNPIRMIQQERTREKERGTFYSSFRLRISCCLLMELQRFQYLVLSWSFELSMFRNLILGLQSVSFKLSGGKWSLIAPRDILLILSLDSLDTRSTLQISHLTDSLSLDGLSSMARNCAARPKPEAHARCQDKQFWPQTLGSLISSDGKLFTSEDGRGFISRPLIFSQSHSQSHSLSLSLISIIDRC